jgi:hypothetical protein
MLELPPPQKKKINLPNFELHVRPAEEDQERRTSRIGHTEKANIGGGGKEGKQSRGSRGRPAVVGHQKWASRVGSAELGQKKKGQ